jgi:hypothetical protein
VTVRPGDSWGRIVSRPGALRVVSDDAALAAALTDDSGLPTAVLQGDLARTLGTTTTDTNAEIGEFTVDLVQVVLDDGIERTACAHVVAHSPWGRGSWWTGPVLAVMNAEFYGNWDVAPRGHPNDGRVETFECDQGFPIRQRFAVSRRLPSGSHLPHPAVTTSSVRHGSWTFERPLVVWIDGRRVARSNRVEVVVMPDAATIYR